MPIDWMLLFQGIASVSAMVQAAQAALQINELSKKQLLVTVEKAEEKAILETVLNPKSIEIVIGLTEDEKELIGKKIKEIKDEWHETITRSGSQAEWAKATDKAKSDQCALLRIAKQLNRGMLPDEWYKIWADLGCA